MKLEGTGHERTHGTRDRLLDRRDKVYEPDAR